MRPRIAFHGDLPGPPDDGAGVATYVADLGFACHLECTPCRRARPPSPREYGAVLEALTAAAAETPCDRLRTAFYGGDVFVRPDLVVQLLEAIRETCLGRAVRFEAAALSDGTAWSPETVTRFAQLGLDLFQVVLDGPAAIHDLMRPLRRGGSSFRRIVGCLKACRSAADVVVRVDPALGSDRVAELVTALEAEDLLAEPSPVAVFVAPPASYACEARELFAVADLLRQRAPPRRPECPVIDAG